MVWTEAPYVVEVSGTIVYISSDMDKHKKIAITFLAGRERSCDGKVRHIDEASARETAIYRSNRKLRLVAYECPFCGGWHIGKAQS